MRFKNVDIRKIFRTIFLLLLGILICSANAGISYGQKPPNLQRNIDDKQLCAGPMLGRQFCDFFQIYNDNKSGSTETAKAAAKNARNEMIEILRGQIDDYYKNHKDGRRLKSDVLQ